MQSADLLSRAGFGFILVAVPLVTCNAIRASENLTYGDIPLAIGALLLLAVWLREGHPRGVVPIGVVVGAGLLLATGLLSSLPLENVGSFSAMLRFWFTFAVMPPIIMFAASTPQRVQRLIDAWLVAAAANAVVGATDLLGLTNIGMALTNVDFVRYTDRAPGLTFHPNHLGIVAAMALPFAVARLGAGGMRGLAALGLVPLLIVGVVESGSRGASLAAAGGVLILFALGISTMRTRTILLLLAAPVLTFVVLVSVVGNNELTGSVAIDRLGGGRGATLSDAARKQTLRQSLGDAGDHLIVGGGFAVVRTAHNIYLQLLQAGGILALAGFLAYAAAILRRARWLALTAHGSPPWLAALAAAAGASICVWLLYGMVGNTIYDRYLYIPVGITLALGKVHRRAVIGPGQTGDPPPASRSDAIARGARTTPRGDDARLVLR